MLRKKSRRENCLFKFYNTISLNFFLLMPLKNMSFSSMFCYTCITSMSIICQRVTQWLVWNRPYLFWFFHTYLKHLLLKFLWMDQISVSGSNICEWIRIFLSHFCVYRHANLCSGLSPQLIKKEIAFLGILPRKWHQLRFEPAALTDREHLNWVWRSTNYAMSQLIKHCFCGKI